MPPYLPNRNRSHRQKLIHIGESENFFDDQILFNCCDNQMKHRVESIPVPSITEKMNLALMGDTLSDEAAARVEARWQAGIEDAIEDVNPNWYSKLVDLFFDKLRRNCL